MLHTVQLFIHIKHGDIRSEEINFALTNNVSTNRSTLQHPSRSPELKIILLLQNLPDDENGP